MVLESLPRQCWFIRILTSSDSTARREKLKVEPHIRCDRAAAQAAMQRAASHCTAARSKNESSHAAHRGLIDGCITVSFATAG